jgi:hypothetical protein
MRPDGITPVAGPLSFNVVLQKIISIQILTGRNFVKVKINSHFVLVILVILTFCVSFSTIALCNDNSSQNKITEELTNNLRNQGWVDITFEITGTDTVSIHHGGIKQKSKLTDGQLVSALGSILKPDVVSKLQNSGVKKGIFVDGKSREYPIEISTKYYNQLQSYFNKLSRGR